MSNILEYKGYYTEIKFSTEDKVLYGKIEFIDDLINFEFCSPRFNGNITKFHFNPFPLTKITREFFPSLQTVCIYESIER